MNVVFVAGGLGTRFDEFDIFPKILLPFKVNDSILIHNLRLFPNDNMFLIINERYYEMVCNYIVINNLSVTLIKSSNTNGSNNTIASVKNELPSENLLFIWSDLVLDEAPQIHDTLAPIIFTQPGKYRCRFNSGKLYMNEEYGNVPGIYYVPFSKIISLGFSNYDLVEALALNNAIEKPYNGYIHEYQNKKAFLNHVTSYINDEHITRGFNKITEDSNGRIVKEVTNSKYNFLIQREINWYKKRTETGDGHLIPKLFSNTENRMVLERIDGTTLDTYIRTTKDYAIIKNVVAKISLMYKETTIIDEKDLHEEYYSKTLARVKSIQHLLIHYNELELQAIVLLAYKAIMEYDYAYIGGFGHGDLHASNILITNDKQIKFIDPRGYFGAHTNIPISYDFAKLNYSLSGYDHFNKMNYIYCADYYDEPIKIITQSMLPQQRLLDLITGIIYISLTSYISNNVMKVNIAYQHGIKLLKKHLGMVL